VCHKLSEDQTDCNAITTSLKVSGRTYNLPNFKNMIDIKNAVIKDPRPTEKQAIDYKHTDGSVAITWKELDLNNLKLTSQRFQDGSYSCVFQTAASMLEALTGKVISATPYFWRKNYPEQGSYLQDMGDIFYNRFTTTEALSTSQNQSEAQMNQLKQLTTFLGITGYRQPAIKDIDQIAEAIEAYKQCGLTYDTNYYEYDNLPMYTPKYIAGSTICFGHAICGQAYGLINGVKTIVCRDSATPNGITFITEDFHYHRNTGALYFMGAKDVSVLQDNLTKQVSILQQLINLWKQLIALKK
jgi:hypothetical protein